MKKTGFTIIELLFVIGIIGILGSIITVNLRSATTKSNVVAMKAALANLPKAIGLCCASGTEVLNTAGGGPLCNPTIDANLPSFEQLKATGVNYHIEADCNASVPTISMALTGHQNTACNDADLVNTPYNIVITMNDKVDYPAGCE